MQRATFFAFLLSQVICQIAKLTLKPPFLWADKPIWHFSRLRWSMAVRDSPDPPKIQLGVQAGDIFAPISVAGPSVKSPVKSPAISHQLGDLRPSIRIFRFQFCSFSPRFFSVVSGGGALFCLELPFACVGVARIVSLNNAPCLSCTRPAKHTKRNETKPSQTKRVHWGK